MKIVLEGDFRTSSHLRVRRSLHNEWCNFSKAIIEISTPSPSCARRVPVVCRLVPIVAPAAPAPAAAPTLANAPCIPALRVPPAVTRLTVYRRFDNLGEQQSVI